MAKSELHPPATLHDLDESLAALRAATILEKATAAERAITIARALLARHEARLAALELRAQTFGTLVGLPLERGP